MSYGKHATRIFALLVMCALVSCGGKEEGAPEGGVQKQAPAAQQAPVETKVTSPTLPKKTAKEALSPLTSEVPGRATEAAEAVAEKTEAVKQAATQATKAAQSAAKAATGLTKIPDVLSTAVTIEKVKELAAGLSLEKLQEIAKTLTEAIQSKDSLVQTLTKKLSSLGPQVLGPKGLEVKKQIEQAVSELRTLREKLSAVLSSLKEKGADVSAFEQFVE